MSPEQKAQEINSRYRANFLRVLRVAADQTVQGWEKLAVIVNIDTVRKAVHSYCVVIKDGKPYSQWIGTEHLNAIYNNGIDWLNTLASAGLPQWKGMAGALDTRRHFIWQADYTNSLYFSDEDNWYYTSEMIKLLDDDKLPERENPEFVCGTMSNPEDTLMKYSQQLSRIMSRSAVEVSGDAWDKSGLVINIIPDKDGGASLRSYGIIAQNNKPVSYWMTQDTKDEIQSLIAAWQMEMAAAGDTPWRALFMGVDSRGRTMFRLQHNELGIWQLHDDQDLNWDVIVQGFDLMK